MPDWLTPLMRMDAPVPGGSRVVELSAAMDDHANTRSLSGVLPDRVAEASRTKLSVVTATLVPLVMRASRPRPTATVVEVEML